MVQLGFNTFVNLNGQPNQELTDLYLHLFLINGLLTLGVVTNIKDFISGVAKEWGLNQGAYAVPDYLFGMDYESYI
ncbi:hypothetical protein [uncultured Vagococcus sp.]|uniref:hypothetical protein n=1 Tax=uncultured Vagococcus sp. TaxID=189676 RepID=UPI0028D8C026|nr:hypothetical protein [uncultured Vagococcus sp.]